MMRRILVAMSAVALATSAFADAPSQVGQVPSFTKVSLDQYFLRDSEMIVTSQSGLIGIVGASRSSDDVPGGPDATIGLAGVVLNDGSGGAAWAGYFEATHEGAASKTVGLEIAVKNRGANVSTSPYFFGNGPTGIWMAAGSDASYGGSPANPSDVAIHIGKNASTWNSGIVFNQHGLTGTDGVTGTGTAISMAKGHIVSWRAPGNHAGANLYSDVATPGKSVGQVFIDDGVMFVGSSGVFASFSKSTTPRFGTHQATTSQAICGFMEVRDVSGTPRKLAVLC